MKPALIAILVAVLLCAGVVGMVSLRHSPHGAGRSDLVLYGNVDIREVQLAFRQPGRLLRTASEEGDQVTAGQLLAELDAVPYRQAVAVASADLASARAELARLRNGSRPQEIRVAEEAEHGAAATALNAEAEFTRLSSLVAAKAVSDSSVDAARAARDASSAALNAARQTLALLREGSRAEDIEVGAARLAGAEARLSQAATALDDTRLVAPANAVVLTRVREAGSMVSATEPVYTLSLRDPLYIRAYVGERELGRVAQGTPVTVRCDSSAKVYSGQIGFVSARAEFTPKTVETADLRTDLVYRVRIVIPKADDALRQGMPVTVMVGPTHARGD
jgi:HlyD family secretion protein